MALTLPQPAETSLAAVLLLATAGPNRDCVIEELDEAESLRLISAGGIGRIDYQSPPALLTRLVVEVNEPSGGSHASPRLSRSRTEGLGRSS